MNLNEVDFLIILSSIIILIVVLMMILIYVFFLKKKSSLIFAQREKEALFQYELSLAQVEMKEQTLSYIGQELHDDLGQKLSVARLLNNQLISKLEEENKENLTEINNLIGECVQDIRNLSKTLITEQIEHFGLIDSIEREVKRINKLNLIELDFSFNKHDIDINSKHALILFRITQECINNVLKHSRAKNLKIKISDEENLLKICLKDNGVGYDSTKINDGSGIKNMKNRAKIISADLNITSETNKGTEISIFYHKI